MSIALGAVAQLAVASVFAPVERTGKAKAERRIVAKRDRDQAPERR